jgi:hypothetical protein
MRAFALALIMVLSPLAAHAGEAVPYSVDGGAFEGYRAMPAGASKGLVVIIHAWGGLTSYEQKRADMPSSAMTRLPSTSTARATDRLNSMPERERRPSSMTTGSE